ncbi:MAG TPA: hypothetical protein VNL77_04020 [Roseiflexaceae bacterium]|nr:hypothetical protein [Roseiflexaceae bacterium]
MRKMQRVTITLTAEVLDRAREMSAGNLSQFISDVLRAHCENERLCRLREDLIAAAIAKAEEDLETVDEALKISLSLVPIQPGEG